MGGSSAPLPAVSHARGLASLCVASTARTRIAPHPTPRWTRCRATLEGQQAHTHHADPGGRSRSTVQADVRSREHPDRRRQGVPSLPWLFPERMSSTTGTSFASFAPSREGDGHENTLISTAAAPCADVLPYRRRGRPQRRARRGACLGPAHDPAPRPRAWLGSGPALVLRTSPRLPSAPTPRSSPSNDHRLRRSSSTSPTCATGRT